MGQDNGVIDGAILAFLDKKDNVALSIIGQGLES